MSDSRQTMAHGNSNRRSGPRDSHSPPNGEPISSVENPCTADPASRLAVESANRALKALLRLPIRPRSPLS